ncbi:hypothetical protein MHBO_003146, partial [Bonamia ostreae]
SENRKSKDFIKIGKLNLAKISQSHLFDEIVSTQIITKNSKSIQIDSNEKSSEDYINSKSIQDFEKLKRIFIQKNCHKTEGIFRKSPNLQKLERILRDIKKGNISIQNFDSPHLVASSIKIWLNSIAFKDRKKQFRQFIRRQLPKNFKLFGNLDSEFIDVDHFYVNFEKIISSIGFERKHVLVSLLELLNAVKCNKKLNKMDSKSLGILFAPVFFSFEDLAGKKNKIPTAIKITENFIENYPFFPKMGHLEKKDQIFSNIQKNKVSKLKMKFEKM